MLRIKNCFLSLLLFCLWQENVLAQNETQKKIDSLQAVLKGKIEDTARIHTLNRLSWNLITAGEKQKAREAAELSMRLADKINYKFGKAGALNDLATLDWGDDNLNEAMNKYNDCAKMNEEIGNKLGVGHNLNNIGNIYYVKTDYSEAEKYYKLALKAYEEAGDIVWVATAYNNLGATFGDQGNYPEALKYYLLGLKSAKEGGDKAITTNLYLNIGNIYLNMNNFSEALKNYQTYLTVARETGKKVDIVGAYSAIGNLYSKQGNYTDALKNYSVALKGFVELDIKSLAAGVYNSIGSVYLHQSNYPEALKNFNAAANILQAIGFNEQLTVSYINIGDILSRQAALEKDQEARNKKYNEAIRILNKGLSLAKNAGTKENIKNGYAVLSELYKGMKDYKKALEYTNLYIEVKDSLMNNEVTRELEQQRTQYEVEKSVEEEKIKNETALAEQKARLKSKNELLLAGFAILAIISFLIALLIRQRNQKRRAVEKAETGHKMAELELQSLRAQLNPHFMFNSLNAIQDLILKEDNRSSHRYLSRFSKLLRMLLDNANQPFIPLRKELDFLELYLSLENLRIPDLQHSIKTEPGIDAETTLIPNMMLQPYIENAIWHGLSHKTSDKKLEVSIHKENGSIHCDIKDNGVGRKKAEELKSLYRKEHRSKGMELLSKRFSLLSKEYGAEIQTHVTDLVNNGEAAGTLVEISVPLSFTKKTKEVLYDTNHYN